MVGHKKSCTTASWRFEAAGVSKWGVWLPCLIFKDYGAERAHVSTDYLLKDELEELPAIAIAADYVASSVQGGSSILPPAHRRQHHGTALTAVIVGEFSIDSISISKTVWHRSSKVSLDTATEYLDAIASNFSPHGRCNYPILGLRASVSLASYSEDALYFDPMLSSSRCDGIAGICTMMPSLLWRYLLILQDMKLAKFKQPAEASLELQYGVLAAVRRRAPSQPNRCDTCSRPPASALPS